jgi:hypothetical protein
MSRRAIGGCWDAEIEADGDDVNAQRLITYLGAGVEILDFQSAALCWWGYVNEIVFSKDQISYGVSLDHMHNRIAVAYTDISNARKTTGWAEDPISISDFGIKELLASMTNVNEEQANAKRDSALTGDKRISRPRGVASDLGGRGSGVRVRLVCHGWWRSLDWRYVLDSRGLEAYDDNGSGIQNLGEGSGINFIYQTFATPVGTPAFSVNKIAIWPYRQGNPTDNLIAEIRPTASPTGQTALASAVYDGPTLPTDAQFGFIEKPLSAPVTIDQTTRNISIYRSSGAQSLGDYYRINVNRDRGYPRGFMQIRTGSVWGNGVPDPADLLFKLIGEVETTQQIASIVQSHGQFLTGCDVETSSGVFASQLQDGDSRASEIIDTLIDSATATADWLLVDVNPLRRVRIYAAPQPGTDQYFISSSGDLVDRAFSIVRKTAMKVGVWMRLRNVFPVLEQSVHFGSASSELIERAEWSASYNADGTMKTERVRYTPRNARHTFDTGGFTQG